MILLSLILAAAPPVLLEPDAGTAHRLHPRRVTASSFLENGWNKHAQNYLPLYVADDDPATAWVEGAKGTGVGEAIEWWGPELTRAKAFRVFLRNGYQKTEKLYRANARPKAVKLEPLGQGETGPQTTGTAVEVELKDVLGWQEVRLPVPAKVQGVRLTLVSTYPGASYDDTCLSDLRVYVEGEDPYKAEMETAAFEQVRAYAYERKLAAARNDTQAKLEWAAHYDSEDLFIQKNTEEQENFLYAQERTPTKWLAAVPEKKAWSAQLARAKAVAALFERADLNRSGKDSEARAQWLRVKPAQLRPQRAAATSALSFMEDPGLVRVAGLLHLADAAFFEADATQAQMHAKISSTRKSEARALAACVKQCEADNPGEKASADESVSRCEYMCMGYEEGNLSTRSEQLTHQLTGGEYVQGTLAKPTAFLRGLSEENGNRESWINFRQTLVTYSGDKADTVLIMGNKRLEDGDDPIYLHVLDWREAKGKAKLSTITTFIIGMESVRVLRYVAATNA
ncbi:NADase-type glycan-binding domain-containing protein [Myxococcus qinghaiensis]|uniref:NADase-type glycan-binding domain-containing protein n=1 Tax=Myxococcus qinghaiensis TaxID=2906758 RepID=UPI0020A7CB3D|nr:hypothetical protein [Myxococcus qinghaiensis]MCP3168730.1 hypothetical protein [Myxococcus qinghaiensis]